MLACTVGSTVGCGWPDARAGKPLHGPLGRPGLVLQPALHHHACTALRAADCSAPCRVLSAAWPQRRPGCCLLALSSGPLSIAWMAAACRNIRLHVAPAGANMANSYLMRPGSSTVEITPYEFGKMKGVFGPCTQNAQVCAGCRAAQGMGRQAGRQQSMRSGQAVYARCCFSSLILCSGRSGLTPECALSCPACSLCFCFSAALLGRQTGAPSRPPSQPCLKTPMHTSHLAPCTPNPPRPCRTPPPSCCGGLPSSATPLCPPRGRTRRRGGSPLAGGLVTAARECPGLPLRRSWKRLCG